MNTIDVQPADRTDLLSAGIGSPPMEGRDRPNPAKRLAVAVLPSVLVVVASACGSSAHADTARPPASPRDLYQPPRPLPARRPGTLIWAEKVALPLNPPATIWR